jgi:hypothetical protein
MPDYTPVWLDVADVKAWLRIAGADTIDDDLLARCAAAVEPQVQRARPDQTVFYDPDDPYPPDPPPPGWPVVYEPDAEVYQAAGMLAAKMYRRRNSPGGIESYGDQVLYPARWDQEIDLALRTANRRLPAVG